jgi:hypothetical protein
MATLTSIDRVVLRKAVNIQFNPARNHWMNSVDDQQVSRIVRSPVQIPMNSTAMGETL